MSTILTSDPTGRPQNMNITTSVLDPITLTDTNVVFQLPKTGIIDSGSFVQLAVKVDATADGEFFFPINTGIHGLIKHATLRIGNKVICTTQDYAHYKTMKNQFKTPESRAFIDMVKSGSVGSRFGASSEGRLEYRDLSITRGVTSNLDASLVPEFIKPTASDSTTPVFSVMLSELFPMLLQRKLPLAYIKEHMYIELEFNRQLDEADVGKICCRTQGTSNSPLISLSRDNIKFIFDSLYYDNDSMSSVAKLAQSKDGLSMIFEDLILTQTSVPAVAAPATTTQQVVEREIATAGKTVRNLLITEKQTGQIHKFLGEYTSRDSKIPSSVNYRINEMRVYDRDIVEPPRKLQEVSLAAGETLMVPDQLYSYDSDTDKSVLAKSVNQQSTYVGKIEGHQCPAAASNSYGTDTDFRGVAHYEGLDLTTTGANVLGSGTLIGTKPMRLTKTYTRTADDFGARDMRIYAGVERFMTIRDGEVFVSA